MTYGVNFLKGLKTMTCTYCENGIVTEYIARDAGFYEEVRPCPHCCNNKAYYSYIKEKYGKKKLSKNRQKASCGKKYTSRNVLKFPLSS